MYVKLLIDFKKRLGGHNKCLEDYGLHIHPKTKEVINLNTLTELEEIQKGIDMPKAQAKVDKLNQECPNNADQEAFMEHLNVSFSCLIQNF
jgi:hypothetical protein